MPTGDVASGESHGGHSGDDKGCGGDGGEEGPRVGFVAVCIVEPAPFTPGSSKAGSDSIDVILSQLVPLPVGRSRDSFSLLLPYHSSSSDESSPASGRKKEGRTDVRKEKVAGRQFALCVSDAADRLRQGQGEGRRTDGGRTERRRAKDARPLARPCAALLSKTERQSHVRRPRRRKSDCGRAAHTFASRQTVDRRIGHPPAHLHQGEGEMQKMGCDKAPRQRSISGDVLFAFEQRFRQRLWCERER